MHRYFSLVFLYAFMVFWSCTHTCEHATSNKLSRCSHIAIYCSGCCCCRWCCLCWSFLACVGFFFLDNDDTNDLIFQFAVVFLTQKVILAVNYIEHATLASKPQQTLYYHFIPNKFIFLCERLNGTCIEILWNLNIEFSLPKNVS